MDDICITFGKNVKRLRRAKEVSQEELADKAGIHRSYLAGIESDEGRNPTLRVMGRIADALEADLIELLKSQG